MCQAAALLVGVCLAAGAGSRLRPLTTERPKVLCPVGGRPLLSFAIDRLVGVTDEVVVNVHHHRAMMLGWLHLAAGATSAAPTAGAAFWRGFDGSARDHPERGELQSCGTVGPATAGELPRLPGDAAVASGRTVGEAQLVASLEGPEALGTAGALAALADHLDGRSVLAINADSLIGVDLSEVVARWDGERPLVAHGGEGGFRPGVPVVASITPWSTIAHLAATPSGLYGHVWKDAHGAGALQTVRLEGPVIDCGTPRRYLAANLALSGGATLSEYSGDRTTEPARTAPAGVTRSVLWAGAEVEPGERLDGAVRTTGGRTMLVRPVPGGSAPPAG
ncbi:MAG: sugar phosphate nucleotidyltransferase [Microthrixaceae bacterium]